MQCHEELGSEGLADLGSLFCEYLLLLLAQ